MNSLRIGITFILVLISTSFSLQGDWSKYKPATIADIISTSKKTQTLKEYETDFIIGGEAYRVKLSYAGLTRPIDPTTRGFISFWAKLCGRPQTIVDLFEREALFAEGDSTYWLPVQSSLVSSLAVPKNQGVIMTVYIIWLGSIGNKQFYFIVNRYDEPQ